MKLIHLSDLHIGKRVNEFSMLDDQKYILDKIINIIDSESPDGVVIAGDVYDKSVPPAEAVQLFDDFLVKLTKRKILSFIISGNHDSAERIAFGSRIMDAQGVHLSPVYDGKIKPITLTDEYGDLNMYLLPFIKPAHVRRYFEDENITTYTDAVRAAVNSMHVDTSKRNILVAHQFVTGAKTSESEEISVGGTDNVDASVFEPFDYVALGHIHAPQHISRDTVRYCGTPLKYSFSEEKHEKSVTVIELYEKGSVKIRTIPLVPLRDMRTVKGLYNDVISKTTYEGTNTDDYIRVILTDEEDIYDAIGRLRSVYPNIMKLEYDNRRSRYGSEVFLAKEVQNKSPLDLFSEFYEKRSGSPMSNEQRSYMEKLIEDLREGLL